MLAPSLLDVVHRMLLNIKFVGGKFRDLEVNHENKKNWHPTKITRYTVQGRPGDEEMKWKLFTDSYCKPNHQEQFQYTNQQGLPHFSCAAVMRA